MTLDDIRELLELKGWTKTRLAAELSLTENTVNRWFHGSRAPGGPAAILMRIWLNEARQKAPLAIR